MRTKATAKKAKLPKVVKELLSVHKHFMSIEKMVEKSVDQEYKRLDAVTKKFIPAYQRRLIHAPIVGKLFRQLWGLTKEVKFERMDDKGEMKRTIIVSRGKKELARKSFSFKIKL